MIDAIEAIDWCSVPGPTDYYRPEAALEGLHDLARARGRTEAASAASHLAAGGIMHDHSGTVVPAAVPAAPLLLQIAQKRTSAAQAAALELVEDALNLHSWPGFARTRGQVRLCCAIADHVHARAPFLAGLGGPSRSLLATAREHWRADIEETCVEGSDTLVFGFLTGSLPGLSREVELGGTGIPKAATSLNLAALNPQCSGSNS
ncbi:hypothetical protein [Nocardiopsis aegyptia]|uniref:Uncharacterized protein n=1 Tax=Nocardiopsis aegyptia TaxID=220378 RepID=A0A7Z0EI36_9ACTN|nr:hypothetical protein [Nocardiopsis aegyptia]NYJ32367.1 hypothetical protein [Nocardiopsis aegyptia]